MNVWTKREQWGKEKNTGQQHYVPKTLERDIQDTIAEFIRKIKGRLEKEK